MDMGFGNHSQTLNRLGLRPPEGNKERHMLGLRPKASEQFDGSAIGPDADTFGDAASFATDGSEVERLRDMIAQLMHKTAHDPLTALPTRSVLLEQLEHELARDAADGAQIAVLFV